MQERGITRSILSIALKKANEVRTSRVTKINLVIGELSGVVNECVGLYFDFLSKDTIAIQANLSFSQIPTRLRCRSYAAVSFDEEKKVCRVNEALYKGCGA